MTKRSPVSPAAGPLEDYAQSFDDLFGASAQGHGFRRYLEGLLTRRTQQNFDGFGQH
jgi:hypothetical protein